MDETARLALGANNQTTILRAGRVIHVDGVPYELLDDVEAFSATSGTPRDQRQRDDGRG